MRMLVAALAILVFAAPAAAQIAISANDGKAEMKNGVNIVPAPRDPDTITILDLSGVAPHVLGELEVPTSVIGPPQSVAIAPDGRYALVTAATKIDPADAHGIVPDDKVSVVDLKSLKVIQTLQAGLGASGVSINAAGTLALVCNRAEDTISIFAIAGETLTVAGKLNLAAKSSPAHVVFTPDGQAALVTRDGDSAISVLDIDGTKVTKTADDISAGLRPYGIEMSAKGDIAVVANIGRGAIDNASFSVIDLKTRRVVRTITAGPTPEGISLSADGQYLAVSAINGSDKIAGTRGFHDFGFVQVFRRKGFDFHPVAMARTGHWCEGAAWSRNHRMLLIQCMVEKRIFVYAFDGKTLTRTDAIPVKGGPAGIRVAQ